MPGEMGMLKNARGMRKNPVDVFLKKHLGLPEPLLCYTLGEWPILQIFAGPLNHHR